MAEKGDRIEMSQRERDRLRVLQDVEEGKCSQAKAAQLLKLSVRQMRRLQERWRKQGDAALVHRLRGQPSNRRHDGALKKKVLQAYRRRYADFGPTFACEKLAADGLVVTVTTLRRWLLAEGLWQRRRRRRPRALYTDRHGIFEAHKKGQADYEGETQFSRALAELGIEKTGKTGNDDGSQQAAQKARTSERLIFSLLDDNEVSWRGRDMSPCLDIPVRHAAQPPFMPRCRQSSGARKSSPILVSTSCRRKMSGKLHCSRYEVRTWSE